VHLIRSAVRIALLTLPLLAGAANAAEPVTGELVVAGKSIALNHARAHSETGSPEDPVTFVLLTEKPIGPTMKEEMDALMGRAGAAVAIHVHQSGKVKQALWLHEAADPTWSIEAPTDVVRVSNLKVSATEISGRFATAGETKTDGHTWTLAVDFETPIVAMQ
jgi:hypothetical protein